MNVKIDTKEKFTVITPIEEIISANMTDELNVLLLAYAGKPIPHVILNMNHVETITLEGLEKLASLQQQFYEKNCSFVVCGLNEKIKNLLEQSDLLEALNVTPSESEAWDIVQMEEIERELLNNFDHNEND